MVVVVPFRSAGKTRLPALLRRELALAMLGDVVEAAGQVGEVRVVTADVEGGDVARALAAAVVPDPGGGQGAAVAAGLAGAVGTCLVVNADLPLATPTALARLAAAAPALVAADDGTTNALALTHREAFVPSYGADSASRFAAAGFVPVPIAELKHDVDTLDDFVALRELHLRLGTRTTLVVNHHKLPAAAR